MFTHKIDSVIHNEFLNEHRQDPITGDHLQVGDEIVICAACQSAFLKESWEYINFTHCNQRATLAEIPKTKSIYLEKSDSEKVVVTTLTDSLLFFLTITPFMLCLMFTVIISQIIYEFSLLYINFASITFFILQLLLTRKRQNKHTHIVNSTIYFNETPTWSSKIHFSAIEHIEILVPKRVWFSNLLGKTRKKSIFKVKLVGKTQERTLFMFKEDIELLCEQSNLFSRVPVQTTNKHILALLEKTKKLEKQN